jgi:hypothetical protein
MVRGVSVALLSFCSHLRRAGAAQERRPGTAARRRPPARPAPWSEAGNSRPPTARRLHHHVPVRHRAWRAARPVRSGLYRALSVRSRDRGLEPRRNDFLRLLDAKGETVLEFSEVESGIFEAPRPGVGILFIQNATAPVRRRAPRPGRRRLDVMRGAGTGRPICQLSLSRTRRRRGVRDPGEDRRATPSSRASVRRPGRSIAANWCSARRAASTGASSRRTPAGAACRSRPIH